MELFKNTLSAVFIATQDSFWILHHMIQLLLTLVVQMVWYFRLF